MKVQGWPADAGGCAWYRIETPLGSLTDDEVNIDIELPHEVLDEPDTMVVLQRSTTPPTMMTLDYFQRNARPWVYDIDDLLWKLTPDNPAYGYYVNPQVSERLRWHLRNAPLLTVSTAELAEEAKQEGAGRVAVVPNCLPDHLFDVAEAAGGPKDGRRIVLWRGSPTHRKDIEVAKYAMSRLARRDDVRIVLAGVDYRKELGCPNAEFLPWVKSPEAYVRQIIALQPDVAICPLAPSRFNYSKSHVNALEASLAGAFPVCTDISAYNSFVDDEVNGLLLSSKSDAWHKALQTVLSDDFDLDTARTAARENAARFRVSHLKDQYRDLLESART